MINPDELKVGLEVNPSKVADVKKLLETHFGQEWHHLEALAWYRDISQGNEQQPEQPGVAYYVEDEPECECMVQEVDNIGLNWLCSLLYVFLMYLTVQYY